jgi:hypothetical protein
MGSGLQISGSQTSPRTSWPWSPLEGPKRHAPSGIEFNAFLLQPKALYSVAAAQAANTYRATRVDHTVPRQPRTCRKSMQRVTHLPRVKWYASQSRHLTIRSDPPTRNTPHYRIDPFVEHATITDVRRKPLDAAQWLYFNSR